VVSDELQTVVTFYGRILTDDEKELVTAARDDELAKIQSLISQTMVPLLASSDWDVLNSLRNKLTLKKHREMW